MNDNGFGTDPAASAAAAGIGVGMILVYLVVLALMCFCYWKVVTKAGYPGYYSLLLFVPCVNLVAFVFFAIKDWPIEEELRRLRQGGPMPPSEPGASNYYRPPGT
jgi:hypothetical protein